LSNYITISIDSKRISIPKSINKKSPVYFLNTKYESDWIIHVISRIKKTRYIYRTFDPNESPRLSANDAIAQVAESYGIIVPLISSEIEDYLVHNIRGAFIAGLSKGMCKALCILQYGDDPVPLDYRDLVCPVYNGDKDINNYIAEFAGRVAESFQQIDESSVKLPETFLESLDLGASSAENEIRFLEKYYLKTDQYFKSLRGEAHLVVGRKGSGKSAIFLQIRDKERSKNDTIVLDLKPDGYKLIKFKEEILSFLEEGTFQHTIMAFWEYVLYLEICRKILSQDKENYLRDHNLFNLYKKIHDLYNVDDYSLEGDFSERLTLLINNITTKYKEKNLSKSLVRLSTPQITEILYCHDLKEIKKNVTSYMKHKNMLWLLFDNIDKGWPTSGLEHQDLIIIRALIDATRRIERVFSKEDIDVKTIVFLRNDVYELLVSETSDRGKEGSVLLDWTDKDLLGELLRLRIISNIEEKNSSLQELWLKICISHFNGEDTLQYLLERSLMRPRFLINLINHCKSFAINLNHAKIQEEDIEKGLQAYSTDLLSDICYELKDIDPSLNDVLYAFIESPPFLTNSDIISLLKEYKISNDNLDKIIHLLLWYGFLGILMDQNEVKYIYDLNYNMQLFEGIIKKKRESAKFAINPAFYSALMIK